MVLLLIENRDPGAAGALGITDRIIHLDIGHKKLDSIDKIDG